MTCYFAYGSNMSEERMKQRVKNYKILGKGILKGYKLTFNKPASKGNGEGYANIVRDEKDIIEGIIYEINESAIEKLDSCEGVPAHYCRKVLRVSCDNKSIECEVYIASKAHDGLRPTKEYLLHLLQGKKFISSKYFDFLKSIPTLD